MSHPSFKDPVHKRIHDILHTDIPLCRNDVVWMLMWIKKKVAEGDPALRELPQPRLMINFHYFAETAMALTNRRPGSENEMEQIRRWLAEASYGLVDPPAR
ncbi:hypothetical protein [Paenibacillus senegalensis]|uniref:hypothetical protein n=1 Tax=Paenibacillus senegalensis TaxID=1465766 RepID=UPI00028813C8|nr:hypothetical protein [Paenibacillus senegalensis]